MDDFGVLVEGMGGFKSPRNSTPLAELKKHKPKSQATNSNTQSSSFHSDDLLDTVSRSPPPPQHQSFSFFRLEGDHDVIGGTGSPSTSHKYDLESVFTSNNLNPGKSAPFNDDVDDLLGGFVGNSNQKQQEERTPDLDDLIPGFGEPTSSSSTTKVKKPETIVRPNSSSNLVDAPFLVFESPASETPHAAWPHATPSDSSDPSTTQHPKGQSSFDDFIMGANTSGSTVSGTDFVDEIFGGSSGAQQKSAAGSTPMSEDSIFGDFFSADKGPEVNPNSTSLFTVQKTTFMAKTAGGEFSSLFGEVTTSSGVFQEIEGESEDRRRARLNRHIRTNARMAEALAEKNQRDLESQFEQEEKRRLAQKLNDKLRRWSTGKEGNLRALLSSLQEVLWPECGWRPVSLTDMITSESVKKVYKKATLCVHPDKVQQKGASIEQKYIAEKVFDLLKEAWNKFCREELR